MNKEVYVADPLDFLKNIIRGLRTTPVKQVNGGVLVREILDDSCISWAEFLQEMVDAAEGKNKPPL